MRGHFMRLSLQGTQNGTTAARSYSHIFRVLVQSLSKERRPKPILPQICAGITKSVHSQAESSKTVLAICDHLKRDVSWDSLSRNLGIELSSLVVDEVLVELKEPVDAKRALTFFHWSARQNNYEHSVRSYCIVVHILVCAQLLDHARALLESVINRSNDGGDSRFQVTESLLSTYAITNSSPKVFNLLIQTYAKLRMFDVAFDVCRCLEDHGFSTTLISFNKLIHVVQRSDKTSLVWRIYEYMLVRRVYPDEVTTRIMIDAMCKEGMVKKFVDVLDRIHGKKCSPTIIVNTALVFRILEEWRVEEGILLLRRMLQRDMILDDIAYSLIIYAQCKDGNFEIARESYEDMLKKGHCANSFLYTLFIGIHCEEGEIEKANHLMQEMIGTGLKPYDETYSFLIKGCAKVGRLEESLYFNDQMLTKGFLPSCSTFNTLVRKLCEVGDVAKANNALGTLLDRRFVPNEVTFAYLIDGFGKEGDVQEVLKLFYEMEYRGHEPGLKCFTSLIRSLCMCGKLAEAEKYLNVMKSRSFTPTRLIYNTLIAQRCEKGDMVRALCHYDEMITKKLKPSSHTFALLVKNIISACSFQNTNSVIDGLRS